MLNKKKLCVLDVNFVWPPDGGAPVDLMPILRGYSGIYDTSLLIPRLVRFSKSIGQPWPLNKTKFFLRGSIECLDDIPCNVEFIDFDIWNFTPEKVARAVYKKLKDMNIDFLFISDIWYFRPEIALKLKEFKPVMRFFSHDSTCIKGNGILFRNGKICEIEYLDQSDASFDTCLKCALSYYLTYPSPRWIYEFIRSKAFLKSFQKKCLESFDSVWKVLVPNRFMADRIRKFTDTTVLSMPGSIDTSKFDSLRANETKGKVVKFLLTGRINMEFKGLGTALEACEKVYLKRKDFKLLMTSDGTHRNLPFVEITPWRPHREVYKLYGQADVLILPSLWPDPFPLVMQEAMASAMPVIGSKIGGIQESVDDGINGFLFTPGKSYELAEKMLWIIENKEKMEEMGRRAREKAVSEYDEKIIFKKHYLHLFE